MQEKNDVVIKLSRPEALILFDVLTRELVDRDGHRIKGTAERDGEMWAMNILLCALETKLSEPFDSEYGQLVADANAGLERKYGSWPG